jgi:hypothetical protein
MLPGPGNIVHNYKSTYHPENTTDKGGTAENHKNAADIHLKSYSKEKLTNALVSVSMNNLWYVLYCRKLSVGR